MTEVINTMAPFSFIYTIIKLACNYSLSDCDIQSVDRSNYSAVVLYEQNLK
jgi:hypothetical protein